MLKRGEGGGRWLEITLYKHEEHILNILMLNAKVREGWKLKPLSDLV